MTQLFGPGWGNYAIEGIVEVSAPEAVSLLPSTPGWWLLLAALLLLTLRIAWRRLRRWRRDRYRREALQTLATLRQRIGSGEHAALAELAPLLRAVALQVLPRSVAATSDGTQWQALLGDLAPELPPLPVARLHAYAYADTASASTSEGLATCEALERWIARHRGADD